MFDIKNYIKSDVNAARDQFLMACDIIGLRVSAYPGQGTGTLADDQPIYADVALAGSPDAASLIVLAPAAGDLSGYFASAVMAAFLREKLYLELPRHVACLLIHAVNPKGPIWPPFNVIQDNHPLPPSQVWGDQLLHAASSRYSDNIELRKTGIVLDRAGLAALPLSAMAIPAWDEQVINDLERRFLADRQQITLFDFQALDLSTEISCTLDYSERTLPSKMGDLRGAFDLPVAMTRFDEAPSAGIVDQAGSSANTILVKANHNASHKDNVPADDVWPHISTVIRQVIAQMPEG